MAVSPRQPIPIQVGVSSVSESAAGDTRVLVFLQVTSGLDVGAGAEMQVGFRAGEGKEGDRRTVS
jgi:hypothetical protein